MAAARAPRRMCMHGPWSPKDFTNMVPSATSGSFAVDEGTSAETSSSSVGSAFLPRFRCFFVLWFPSVDAITRIWVVSLRLSSRRLGAELRQREWGENWVCLEQFERSQSLLGPRTVHLLFEVPRPGRMNPDGPSFDMCVPRQSICESGDVGCQPEETDLCGAGAAGSKTWSRLP